MHIEQQDKTIKHMLNFRNKNIFKKQTSKFLEFLTRPAAI